MKLVKVPLEDDFTVSAEKMAEQVTRNTIGIVGVAGTTALGLIDPIEEIGKIARENELFYHVDAAFGGFVLPFLTDLGYDIPKWDFEVPEVNSITADPHKMGMNVIPSGGFLLRDCSLLEDLSFNIPYLAGGCFKHIQITGTRPGGVAIAFWALMKSLGREGFRNIVKNAMDLTHYLAGEIRQIGGLKLATLPTMNIVGIIPENGSLSATDLDARLREKGWALGCFRRENLVRVVLMPHVTREHIDAFLSDLKDCL
jgi:tyrosine decarboxylase/aspartate 1-decarboxylase